MAVLGAIGMIARGELRRRWAALVALGVLIGLVVAVVAGTAALIRRTATAHDRLERASAVADLQVSYFSHDPELARRVAAVPGVAQAWTGVGMVGRLEDQPSLAYLGIIGGPADHHGLYEPVVVSGHGYDPADPDEAVLDERAAARWGVAVGDTLHLRLLTPSDFLSFDTGFGTPGGPVLKLTITGLTRTAGENARQMPLTVSPALAGRLDPVSTSVMLRLEPGPRTAAAVSTALRRLGDGLARDPLAGEFPALQVSSPATDGDARIGATQRVLVTGLVVFAVVVGVAGLAAAGQAFYRHHAAGAHAQRIEAVLGLTGPGRAGARTLAALPAAGLAGVTAAAGPLLAGLLEPLGPLAGMEPHPGYAPHLALVCGAGAAAVVITLLLAGGTAARVGRRPADPASASATAVATGRGGAGSSPAHGAAGMRGPVWLWIGTAFALGRRRDRSPATRRPAVAGAAIGVTGLVAAATIAAGLNRLVDEPHRYGWNADLEVTDARPEIVNRLAADPRIAAVSMLDASTATVEVDAAGRALRAPDPVQGDGPGDAGPGAIGRGDTGPGEDVAVYALSPKATTPKATPGTSTEPVGWTIFEGAAPRSPDEAVLGPRAARRFALGVGDTVSVTANDGGHALLTLVGIGVGPVPGGERLGESMLVEPDTLARIQRTQPLRSALVRAVDRVDPVNLAAALGTEYELDVGRPPTEIANLGGIGRLPALLQTVLAALAVAAAGHAAGTTWRRRHGELAILRTLGFTPSQTARIPLTTSCVSAALAVAVGLPAGMLIGRLIWWEIATATGVSADLAIPVWMLVTLPPAAIVVGLLVAALPAWRAWRLLPGAVLRGE
ncbi:ABC transporter permease [Parafrankia discariae]|uniref:ABC transporter permease n=1 Tax=Parafrankia discariae TaxID=365528 RepID=UPI0003742A18|nr:ABC transporter permease [Parafrankia discariae]